MSISAKSFYWRNDSQSFVTWRSRLATAPDTLMCIVIHGSQFTGGVHPPNQFVPEIVSPLPCSHALIVYFFQITYFFYRLPYKCHTSVFNALITVWFPYYTSGFCIDYINPYTTVCLFCGECRARSEILSTDALN